MKIRIGDIPSRGLKVNDTMSLASLNARVQSGSETDIVFLVPPQVDLTVFKTPGGAETQGTVSTKYRQACSRCIKEGERNIEVEANFILQPKPQARNAKEDPMDEDIGILYYENDHIDLEDVLQENLILALSPYWIPPKNSDGSCSLCGVKAEKVSEEAPKATQSFGNLLQQAGIGVKTSKNGK